MTASKRTQRPTTVRRLLGLLAALALFATACGSPEGGPSAEQAEAAITAAESNESQLEISGDLAMSQLLNTADGSITTLADVVTGDRAVLLWFWAPH